MKKERVIIGQKVKYFPIKGREEYIESTIRSDAWKLGHGEWVCLIDCKTGCVSLEHLEIVI